MKPTIKALTIIRDKEITHGRQFGLLMWPDSDAHRQTSNGGHGAQTGKAGWLAAGSFLGRLKKAGLITGSNGRKYRLTDKGRSLLESVKES